MRTALWVSVLILAFTSAAPAADTPALDITGLGSGFDYTQGTYSLGWAFAANKDLNVTALGFYDDLKDGIVGNHDVGIYDVATQTLLVQTTVVPSDPLTGFFRYHTLATPFVLTGGKNYIIQAVTLTDHYALSPNTVVDPAITFMGFAAYGSSGSPQSMTLHYPDGTNPTFVGDFGPSFLISNGGGAAGPVAVTTLAVTDPSNNPVTSGIETGVQLSFNAAATDTAALPLNFTWDFGDGSMIASGAFVQHVYNIEGNFTVTLTASDGTNSAVKTASISAFAPNSGGAGIPNISQTYPAVMNPLNGLAVSIASSDGGVIQLNIDVGSLTRDAFNVSTEFDGLGGRSGTVTGLRPVMKFTTPGINVANVTATDPVSSALVGKGRKTLVIGSAEVGQAPAYTSLPASQKAKKVSVSGKFTFKRTTAQTLAPLAHAASADSVDFGGTIELPAGLDLSTSQTIAVGIGNIIDQVSVDPKGKAQLPSAASLIQKLQIKFPKLSKGQTKTVAKQEAVISLVLSGSNFSANGFDTEGISGTIGKTENAKKPLSRSIQIALLIAGVPYQFSLPVQFKLGAGGATGSLGGRSAGSGL